MDNSATVDVAETPAKPLPRWLPYLLFGLFIALTIVGNITSGAAPRLLKDHPLLLVLGAPRYRWIVAVSPKVDTIPLVVISWLRLLLSDPLYFAIGWFYGDKALVFFESALGKQTMDNTRRYFDKATWVMSAFFAGPVICALAGLAKVKPKKFFSIDVVGTLIVAIILRAFAKTLEKPILAMIRFNDRYWKWFLVVTVLTTIVIFARFATKLKSLSGEVSKFNED